MGLPPYRALIISSITRILAVVAVVPVSPSAGWCNVGVWSGLGPGRSGASHQGGAMSPSSIFGYLGHRTR